MGSPRHTAPHVAALRERGVPAEQVARVHRPIGLDIGSKAPAEIAVSTVAGLLADRAGRSGGAYEAAGMRIVALAGGIGGARFLRGLRRPRPTRS